MIKTPTKIGLIFLKEDRERILDFLQKKEIIQIIERKKIERVSEELIDIRTKIARVKFALNFLALFKEEKKKNIKEKLYEVLVPPKIYLKEEELKEKIEKFNFEDVVEKCQTVQAKITELEKEKAELEKEKNELEKKRDFYQEWRELPYDLESLKKIKTLKVFCGSLKDLQEFEEELRKKTNLYEIKLISSLAKKQKKLKICLLYHFLKEEEVKNLLRKFEAEEIKEIENLSLISLELKKAEEKLKKISEEEKNLAREFKQLFYFSWELKIIYDYLNWTEKKLQVESGLLRGERMFLITGWIKKSRIEELKRGIEKITKNFELFKVKLGKNEEPPVIIENKKIIQPVETVMEIYGMPKPTEIDPVPLMAPFFILFFGFCLSDAGYGLIMTILSLALMKFLTLPDQSKKMLHLLFYCGISTAIMGVFFGSWFGVSVEQMRIVDPIKDPLLVLGIALLLGIFQIMFGIFIKIYLKMKNKMLKEALLDDFPWTYFIFTILIFGTKDFLGLPKEIANYLILSGALFIVLTQSRKTKNIILKPFSGILSLYGIVGYASDVLSYSRLLALSLATAVIASVVNLTAGILKEMIPVVGILVALIVLFFGHVFNVLISCLGAFIHSMRLQFVEFIPKFMEGGGKRFEPFSRELKYVEILE